jgi:hypothetical protein
MPGEDGVPPGKPHGGRCARCTVPMAPVNRIRFWSPFLSNVSNIKLVSNYDGFVEVITKIINPVAA